MSQKNRESLLSTIEGLRPQLEGLGLTDNLRKIDAALLLEDDDKLETFLIDSLHAVRGILVSQVRQLEVLLEEWEYERRKRK